MTLIRKGLNCYLKYQNLFVPTSKCVIMENKLLRSVGLCHTKEAISMLLPLPLHGMKAFISAVGAASEIWTTFCNAEAVTLEPVKLLEALEQCVVLVSDIESRACHRHFGWRIGTSLPLYLPHVNVAFLGLAACSKFLPPGLMVFSAAKMNLFLQYLLKVWKKS